MRIRVLRHIMMLILLLCRMAMWGQEAVSEVTGDGVPVTGDGVPVTGDGVQVTGDSVQEEKSGSITAPVHYQSSDSMVMMGNGTAYLHGKGELKYQSMELTSEYIRMNVDSSQIYAQGVYDSLNGEWVGKPVFKDGQDSYET